MFNKIKEISYKYLYKDREAELQREIDRLKEKVNDTIEQLGDPRHVIARVLKEDLKFFDYKKLKIEEQEGYVNTGRAILTNATYQNEIKSLYVDLVNEIAKSSTDFNNVMELRMTLNGITLLKERIEELGIDSKPTRDNTYAAT